MGSTGSGKSTVGKRLAKDLNWPWISPGEILRQSKESWVIERLKTAQLFDDEMVSNLVLSHLSGVPNAILDGFPRTFKQAENLLKHGEEVGLIVEMEVPVEEIKERLALRGRDQDKDDVIEDRIRDYEATKDKIMAYLIGHGTKLVKVDGVGTQDEVYLRAAKGIQEAIKK
jgi:adenylate kinase family enzyme